MKTWTSEGHLTDLVLELWADGLTEGLEVRRIDHHLQTCQACQAREAEWRSLFHALSALPTPKPSPSFDAEVLARVRKPAAASRSWAPLARRLRPVAVVAAAFWGGIVVAGAAWLGASTGLSPSGLIAAGLAFLGEAAWSAVIRVGALLQVSGLVDLWAEIAGSVPGPGVLSALALMNAFAGLAIWGLYRMTVKQPARAQSNV